MPQQHRQHKRTSESLLRLKRIFRLNLVLAACLAVAWFFLLEGNEEEITTKETPVIDPIKALNLPELANLKGQMLALSEHPGTVPEYQVEWVMKVSRQQIERDTEFAVATEEALEELTQAFFKGYTNRFDDYYDSHAATEFGYHYGLKFDPTLHGLIPRVSDSILLKNRERLSSDYSINDEAEWRLFCEAFDRGFLGGYPQVIDGITVKSRQKRVELFEE